MDHLRAPELFIAQDGRWYADGVLMTKKEIVQLFASHLKKDEHNNYHIHWQNHLYPVEVEDAPFFVQSVIHENGQPTILLYDGRKLPLPEGKIIMKNSIPYTSLFWLCDTKLSRPSYSELCKNLIERDGRYFIKYGDNEWLVEE
ncbi:hypothetical protein Desor_3702 [Desulfosporosinus orientis DSM 765]|uniref:DUF1285 domain-containing protein n=1 Tax=Desulfosporosinus orientis (strain ATCC 19365 / DSM 765 / NCIMB 8382 / VKM B-1628 / Singapore I) TaxID=768706 RepID=G7W6N8_DESOD|nr:DUF1285 domain-containing protein [Desulfosporosinus orientis]AET69170.1 hypothetical protein Desor_3702 [Desulfosporosinus orientis DSM 765]